MTVLRVRIAKLKLLNATRIRAFMAPVQMTLGFIRVLVRESLVVQTVTRFPVQLVCLYALLKRFASDIMFKVHNFMLTIYVANVQQFMREIGNDYVCF